jgi:SAM-dependent methyltransferase
MTGRALSLIAERCHVLDLGCGAGNAAIALACVRADVQVTALDISPANVAATATAAAAAGVAARIELVAADYSSWPGGSFDAIVSDSVLHLIGVSDDALAHRLAADLSPGGFLVATIPKVSAVNRLRIAFRRIWRLLPEVVDDVLAPLAQRVYPDFPKAALRERIGYLRVLPIRLFGAPLLAAFARNGLVLEECEPLPSPSIAKLDHVLAVWRKQP